MNLLRAVGDIGNTADHLLDRLRGLVGQLVLPRGTAGDLLRHPHQTAGGVGDLGRRGADMADQVGKFVHHLVEHRGGLADFVLAADIEAAGQVALAGGDVAQAADHVIQRSGDHITDE